MIIEQDGKQIEVFTQEELDQKLEEEKSKLPKTEELDSLKSELEAKNVELAKLTNKDHNFSEVRRQKDELDAKLKLYEDRQNEFLSNAYKEKVNSKINDLSMGDSELAKKIEFQFNRIKDDAKTDEEIGKKVIDAYLLATGDSRRSTIDGAISSYSSPVKNNGANPVSPELMNVATKLGITAEDIELGKKHNVI